MFPENKNKKIAQGMGSTRSVRRATRYEKPRQDVGVFYCSKMKILCCWWSWENRKHYNQKKL